MTESSSHKLSSKTQLNTTRENSNRHLDLSLLNTNGFVNGEHHSPNNTKATLSPTITSPKTSLSPKQKPIQSASSFITNSTTPTTTSSPRLEKSDSEKRRKNTIDIGSDLQNTTTTHESAIANELVKIFGNVLESKNPAAIGNGGAIPNNTLTKSRRFTIAIPSDSERKLQERQEINSKEMNQKEMKQSKKTNKKIITINKNAEFDEIEDKNTNTLASSASLSLSVVSEKQNKQVFETNHQKMNDLVAKCDADRFFNTRSYLDKCMENIDESIEKKIHHKKMLEPSVSFHGSIEKQEKNITEQVNTQSNNRSLNNSKSSQSSNSPTPTSSPSQQSHPELISPRPLSNSQKLIRVQSEKKPKAPFDPLFVNGNGLEQNNDFKKGTSYENKDKRRSQIITNSNSGKNTIYNSAKTEPLNNSQDDAEILLSVKKHASIRKIESNGDYKSKSDNGRIQTTPDILQFDKESSGESNSASDEQKNINILHKLTNDSSQSNSSSTERKLKNDRINGIINDESPHSTTSSDEDQQRYQARSEGSNISRSPSLRTRLSHLTSRLRKVQSNETVELQTPRSKNGSATNSKTNTPRAVDDNSDRNSILSPRNADSNHISNEDNVTVCNKDGNLTVFDANGEVIVFAGRRIKKEDNNNDDNDDNDEKDEDNDDNNDLNKKLGFSLMNLLKPNSQKSFGASSISSSLQNNNLSTSNSDINSIGNSGVNSQNNSLRSKKNIDTARRNSLQNSKDIQSPATFLTKEGQSLVIYIPSPISNDTKYFIINNSEINDVIRFFFESASQFKEDWTNTLATDIQIQACLYVDNDRKLKDAVINREYKKQMDIRKNSETKEISVFETKTNADTKTRFDGCEIKDRGKIFGKIQFTHVYQFYKPTCVM